ncbi:hypothetical protein SD81_028235 [Tolypothrix campylonemoides VB511288]|nr:hypothetical protein SD81_028235 [Tolypothrix campylonemoides VB511288]
MMSNKLSDLILQTEKLLDAIASNSEYQQLKKGEYLTDLDVHLGDVELFLWQLNKALLDATQATSVKNSNS